MKALVTGGAGFIGSHLAERLAAAGHQVVVADNFASGRSRVGRLESLGAEIFEIDIRDEKVSSLVANTKPDVVFHLAAQLDVTRSVKDPVYDAEVNVLGTLRVLEAASEAGSRVVFASSGGTIYGDDEFLIPYPEHTLGRPTSPYGIGKKAAEDYLRFYSKARGLRFVSLALSNVYGPGQTSLGEGQVVAIFAERLLGGRECVIYSDGEQTRDFVYAGDVADAFVAAVEKGEGETINVGTGIETSVNDLYSAMASICGVDREATHAPARAGELRRSCLATGKAEEVLGWAPKVSLEEGLRRTVDSWR
jgi:UDP-glucose 4-epimerase